MLIVEARKRRYFQIEFDPHQKLPQSKYAEFCILKNCSLCIRTKTRRQTQAPSHIFTKTKENRDKDKQKFLLTEDKHKLRQRRRQTKPSSTYSKAQ